MNQFNYDAQQSLGFVVNQTHIINRQIYETRYPDLNYARLVFVDTSAPEWSGGITTFISDKLGAAKWFSGSAKDVPRADVNFAKDEKTFDMAAIGYGYNIEEVGKAQFLGIPLSSMRADAAKRAYETFMYNLAIRGDAAKGLKGLVNYTGVSAANVPNDGTGTSRLWSTKTPAQIVRDINLALTGIMTDSKETEMADTVLMPREAFNYIAQTPYSANTMETIASFIQRTNVYTLETGRPLTIAALRGLENDGDSGTGRLVAYRNAPDVVRLHLPMPHRFLPVWQDGPLSFEVAGIFRTGGIEVHRPGAMRYLDGITG